MKFYERPFDPNSKLISRQKIDCHRQSHTCYEQKIFPLSITILSIKYFSLICFVSHFLSFSLSLSCRTLLRFHNLRAVILIVLCLIAACEISVAYLLATHTNDRASPPYETVSALAFFASIISTAILLRLIEVRKSHSGEHDLMETFFII